ncbi:MAG: hypothetical protein ACOH5I_26340 [Oligoflexus sp.]
MTFLTALEKTGAASAMHYFILKSSVTGKESFQASKTEIANLWKMSPSRAGKVLKNLVDSNLLKVVQPEDSMLRSGKTYKFLL